ncbi:DUF6089 family protein [Pontibacter sp. G13]|uniref:DUF6089 family protein n=1 Tax=Pontibacter sp. G13 TaxID=3074898 RepID=UPI00288B301F|nr:DUF6089 family protein [Pontibacter sp. G13]WNJ21230.1 DUF6089 family protein [Pontibacter sp. G13]
MNRIALLIALIIAHVSTVFAQRTGSLSIGTGIAYYYGDLGESPATTLIRPGLTIAASKNLSPILSIRGAVSYGTIGAADSLATSHFLQDRNLHFKSNLIEASAVMVLHFVNDKYVGRNRRKNFVSPFIFVGLGGFHFSPKALHQGEWVDLQSLGTEGQNIPNSNKDPYKKVQISIPAGLGLDIRFDRYTGIQFETGVRKLFTDYLDDVSGFYPDERLLREYSGETAVAVSYKGERDTIPRNGIRGNPGKLDMYMFTTLSLVVYFDRFR